MSATYWPEALLCYEGFVYVKNASDKVIFLMCLSTMIIEPWFTDFACIVTRVMCRLL